MKKILVYGGMRKGGGVSKFIIDNYTLIKNDSIEFLHIMDRSPNDYEEYMKLNNMKYRLITPIKANPFKNINEWNKLLAQNKEDGIIHFHIDSLKKFIPLLLARFYNYKVIIHAHNSKNNQGIIGNILNKIGFLLINSDAYHLEKKIGCSEKAADWFYGENSNRLIINNGINCNKFLYSWDSRLKKRHELGLTDEPMIIHVGRFENAKNHSFVIDVFYELHKVNPNCKLVLVGTGSLEKRIKDKVELLKLKNSVFFLGLREDVSELLSASDVMLFPSFHEGLPYSLVESQANGIGVFCSTEISPEVKINENLYFLSLDNDSVYWSEKILKYLQEDILNVDRELGLKQCRNRKYDLIDSSNELFKLYEEM